MFHMLASGDGRRTPDAGRCSTGSSMTQRRRKKDSNPRSLFTAQSVFFAEVEVPRGRNAAVRAVVPLRGDREFESFFLQRGVRDAAAFSPTLTPDRRTVLPLRKRLPLRRGRDQ